MIRSARASRTRTVLLGSAMGMVLGQGLARKAYHTGRSGGDWPDEAIVMNRGWSGAWRRGDWAVAGGYRLASSGSAATNSQCKVRSDEPPGVVSLDLPLRGYKPQVTPWSE